MATALPWRRQWRPHATQRQSNTGRNCAPHRHGHGHRHRHGQGHGATGAMAMAKSNDSTIGIFYSTGTNSTKKVAHMIKDALGDDAAVPFPIKATHAGDLGGYDALIFGAPTYLWDKHRVSSLDFDTIEPPFGELKDLDGVKVAIFGLGDQEEYPKNFCDAIGMLWDHFQRRGAVMVGSVDCEGYSFKRSRALKQGKLCGLAIDLHNQPDLTEPRVANWVAQLRREFGLSGATDQVGN